MCSKKKIEKARKSNKQNAYLTKWKIFKQIWCNLKKKIESFLSLWYTPENPLPPLSPPHSGKPPGKLPPDTPPGARLLLPCENEIRTWWISKLSKFSVFNDSLHSSSILLRRLALWKLQNTSKYICLLHCLPVPDIFLQGNVNMWWHQAR